MQKGFTLVELAIVLVIIGLLIGGILSATELVLSSKRNKTYSEFKSLETAAIGFKLKYKLLPGDNNKAYLYFSADCAASPVLCNGNDNGIIDQGEGRRALNHMANGGFLPMQNYDLAYTGGNWDTPCGAKEGTLMKSVNEKAGYNFTYTKYGNFTVTDTADISKAGFFIALTSNSSGSTSRLRCTSFYLDGVISAQKAWEFDEKFDDGLGRSGDFISYGNTCTGTYNTNKNNYINGTSPYLNFHYHNTGWNSEDATCSIIMWLGKYFNG